MTYTWETRSEYEVPPCSDCGSTNVEVTWVAAPDFSGVKRHVPGMHRCLDCGNLRG